MAQELKPFGITKFLGLITNYVDTEIDPGYALTAQDIDWRSARGALQGAKTHTQYHDRATAVLSTYIYKNYPFYTLAATAYYVDTLIQMGGAVDWGGQATFDEIDGLLIGANGTKVVKFDGTNLDEIGTSVPTVGSFAAAGTGSGSFTVGDWDYVVTFVNRKDVEGNPCAAITATSQGASKVSCNLTDIPVGAAAEGIKARRIYRTVTGGATFYLLTTISDNTTTTYTDTTADGSLGTSSPPSTHNKPTVTCTLITKAGKRIFIAGDATYPRRLWWSLPLPNYECFPLTYYDDFASDIIAICSLGNEVLVLTKNGPVLFGNLDDVSQMRQYDLPSRIPADSSRAIVSHKNKAWWIGPQGGFITTGVTVDEFTDMVTSLFPTNTETSSMEFDTYGTLYIVLNYGAFGAELGKIVALDWSGKTESFSAELGKIVRITSTDTWVFSSEYGKIVALSIGGDTAATMIIKTIRGTDEIWSLDSQVCRCIAHSPMDRKTYVGRADGIYFAFTGDRRSWIWQSVYSNLDAPIYRKQLHRIRLRINGTVKVIIYGDNDTELYTETIVHTQMEVHEVIMPPASWAYKFSIRFEGNADGVVEPPIVYLYTTEVL